MALSPIMHLKDIIPAVLGDALYFPFQLCEPTRPMSGKIPKVIIDTTVIIHARFDSICHIYKILVCEIYMALVFFRSRGE